VPFFYSSEFTQDILHYPIRAMRDNQKHMRLSVRPYLIGHYYLKSDDTLAIEVENRGLGPAILKKWAFWSEDNSAQPVRTGRSSDLKQYIASHLPDSRLPFVFSSKKRESVLNVGERWRVLELDPSKVKNDQMMASTRAAIERFRLQIRYASFYGEEFVETVSMVRISERRIYV